MLTVLNCTRRFTRRVAIGGLLCSLLCAVTCSRTGVDEPPVTPTIPPGGVVWSAAVGQGGMIPVADSTRVYFGGMLTQSVSAVDIRTGAVVWSRTTPGLGFGSRGLALAGDVLVRADGDVYAYDRATGSLRWTFTGTFGSAPGWDLLSTDGTSIYTGGPPAGRVYAIDAATGVARWDVSVATDTTVQTKAFNPTYYRDTVYVGVQRITHPGTGGLAALDARTGRKLWYREFTASKPTRDGDCRGNVAFFGDLVIATAGDGQIIAMQRSDGTVRWIAPPVEELGSSPGDAREVAVSGGVVLASSLKEFFYAYDVTDGRVLWKNSQYGNGGWGGSAADDSTVFIKGAGGQVFAVEARSGKLRWTWGSNTPRGPNGEINPDAVFARPGLDRDFVYISGIARGWKLHK